jgi:hypothetical protein
MAKIYNFSHSSVWITAENFKYPLPARTASTAIGVVDADGLLLDGRSVYFDSFRIDLGGRKTYTKGAIKVCTKGTMYIWDSVKPLHMKVTLDEFAYLYNILKDGTWPAGYHDENWCKAHKLEGWDLATATLGPTAKLAGDAAMRASLWAAGISLE